jgi:hypothetical protein
MSGQKVQMDGIECHDGTVLVLPENLKISVCHICQRFQVTWVGTLQRKAINNYLRLGYLARRGVSRLFARPACTDCIYKHEAELDAKKLLRAGAK